MADGRNGQQQQQSRNQADHLLLLRRSHVVSGVELFWGEMRSVKEPHKMCQPS
jgi:hypothetical protein